MSESFVDLSYRGLPLGRRIKLTQVRPSSGFLELAAPMPVGTAIVITTDEGLALEATVMQIHEQIGGSERVPGMIVAPALAEEAGASWWKERASLPELAPTAPPPPPPPSRSRPVTVRPRSSTIPEARASEPTPPAELVDDAKPTVAMPAVEPEPTEPETEAPIVDDGKKTIMMHSVDLSALGLEAGASGQFAASGESAAAGADDADDADDDGEGGEDADARAGANGDPREAVPAPPTGVGDKKPHGKKRKKRR